MFVELVPLIDSDTLSCIQYFSGQKSTAYPNDASPFIRVVDTSDEVLTAIILDHTQKFRGGQLPWTECVPVFGGYLLQIDTTPVFFPQCCADLSDINYWEELSNGKLSYCAGHPSPTVSFKGDYVLLDFIVGPHHESFQPPPSEKMIELSRLALVNAVAICKKQLFDFEQRLIKLNEQEKWGIQDIGDILIWRK